MNTRVRILQRLAAVASASTAQAIQSLTSMVILVLASRLLGVESLGLFSILYGALILAAAITTGFVGDTLTVLDRHDPHIQAGLRFWALVLAVGLGIAAGLLSWLGAGLSWQGALLYGLAGMAYVAEELIRRSQMAVMNFGQLILIDLMVLAATALFLLAAGLLGRLSLEVFLLAILVGQASGTCFGWLRLPRSEKVRAARPAAIRAIAAFGVWRAALQGLRPAQLTTLRIMVTALVGLAAAGQMEAARIYAAPAMLLVSGTCSYLFASLALDRSAAFARQLRSTDMVVLKLLAATVGSAAIGLLLLPWGGPLLTGMQPSALAVAGWLAYASSVSVSTPYGLLAAVREHARPVFWIRCLDTLLSIGLSAAVLLIASDYRFVPWAAAAGALAGGLTIRYWMIRTVASNSQRAAAPSRIGILKGPTS